MLHICIRFCCGAPKDMGISELPSSKTTYKYHRNNCTKLYYKSSKVIQQFCVSKRMEFKLLFSENLPLHH